MEHLPQDRQPARDAARQCLGHAARLVAFARGGAARPHHLAKLEQAVSAAGPLVAAVAAELDGEPVSAEWPAGRPVHAPCATRLALVLAAEVARMARHLAGEWPRAARWLRDQPDVEAARIGALAVAEVARAARRRQDLAARVKPATPAPGRPHGEAGAAILEALRRLGGGPAKAPALARAAGYSVAYTRNVCQDLARTGKLSRVPAGYQLPG